MNKVGRCAMGSLITDTVTIICDQVINDPIPCYERHILAITTRTDLTFT
jgi:hypothetical protein